MHQQGVFVGFKAAQHGVHGVAPLAEHGFHLLLDAPGVLDGRCRVAMEPGAAPVHAAAREVVSDEQQHPPPLAHAALHIPGQHLAQVRPSQVEHAPQVAKRLDDAQWRVRGHRNVDAPVHALEHANGRGVQGQVALAGEPVFGAAESGRVVACALKKPVDALGYGFAVDVHGRSGVAGCRRDAVAPWFLDWYRAWSARCSKGASDWPRLRAACAAQSICPTTAWESSQSSAGAKAFRRCITWPCQCGPSGSSPGHVPAASCGSATHSCAAQVGRLHFH